MGEYETTIERLNKVLVENGFAKILPNALYPPLQKGIAWHTTPSIELHFDECGKYVKPEGGEYSKGIFCITASS